LRSQSESRITLSLGSFILLMELLASSWHIEKEFSYDSANLGKPFSENGAIGRVKERLGASVPTSTTGSRLCATTSARSFTQRRMRSARPTSCTSCSPGLCLKPSCLSLRCRRLSLTTLPLRRLLISPALHGPRAGGRFLCLPKLTAKKTTRGAGDALRWPLIKAEEPSPKHESRERRARLACHWFALLKRNHTGGNDGGHCARGAPKGGVKKSC
jgi:hypothetical protein